MIPNHFLCDTGHGDKVAAVFGSAKAAATYVDFLKASEQKLSGRDPTHSYDHVVRIRALNIDKCKVPIFIVMTTRTDVRRGNKNPR